MSEDPQRVRLAAWADQQGVDESAKLIFLSLPYHSREAVRDKGQVQTGRNPSALLMARMREVYAGHIELDEQARQDRTFRRECAKPMVWIFVRGESNRDGWRRDRSTGGSSDAFEANMSAIVRHMAHPLEAQGMHVLVGGDLRTAVGSEEDIKARFRKVFGRRTQYCRAQAEMLGARSWDMPALGTCPLKIFEML